MGLIPSPDLDVRTEERLAAEAIARTSGGLTVERIDSQIEMLQELRALVAGGTLQTPVCPELTNANVSSPHTVLLETMGWLMAFIARRINLLPLKVQIEFARLFQVELREATAAVTILTFTAAAPPGTPVTVPAGTEVSTADDSLTLTTDEDLVILADQTTGTVSATRTIAGYTLLSPAKLTKLTDAITYVTGVTNATSVDSGTDAETIDQALARAVSYQRRAERLVTAHDLEDAVLQDIIGGPGLVKAFPFVRSGDFETQHAGETTLIVGTPTGLPLTDAQKESLRTLLQEAVGNQFIYVLDPQYVEFSVTASIKVLSSLTPQATITAAIERNLRAFYAPAAGNFGRRIARSEMIATIQGTEGVARIATDGGGDLILTPAADVVLAPYELPKLNSVVITVVP
jgi:hypothetical protein